MVKMVKVGQDGQDGQGGNFLFQEWKAEDLVERPPALIRIHMLALAPALLQVTAIEEEIFKR